MMRKVKLGEVCLVRRGTTITKKQTVQGNIPVIGGGTKPTYFHNKANGKWNNWSAFNACSVTCGGGLKTRSRICSWSGGGKACQCPWGSTCKPTNCWKSPCKAFHSARCKTNICPGNTYMIVT